VSRAGLAACIGVCALLAAGCSRPGALVLSLGYCDGGADAPLTELTVSVTSSTAGTGTAMFHSISPPGTLAVTYPDSLGGPVSIAVTAEDGQGGTWNGQASAVGLGRVDPVPVCLRPGSPVADGGQGDVADAPGPVDVAADPDAPDGDLAGDLPDLTDLPTDPPADAPLRHNYVFFTNQDIGMTMSTSPGDLGPYDDHCNQEAWRAGLPGNYLAWLSTTTQAARRRLELSAARGWVRPDERPFADTVAQLAMGHIFYPPRLDSQGNDALGAPSVLVMTGTDPNGGATASATCGDYMATAATVSFGCPSCTTNSWTAVATIGCSGRASIYCFGIDSSAALTVKAPAGRRAFAALGYNPMTDLGTADTFCHNQAVGAGLGTGATFLAFLATSNQTAGQRFTAGSTTWVRSDGVALADDPASVLAGQWLAPLNVTADGTGYLDASVWTGTATENCQNWTSNSNGDNGEVGSAVDSSGRAFSAGTPTCNGQGLGVYCLEQ
jgi:hypothetical protein